MFYVKEDDMDDLLRKAAENYEVDADKGADWNSVLAAVHETAPLPAAVQEKRKRRFVFWWLLLIPVGWFAGIGWNKWHNRQQTAGAVQKPLNTVKEKPSVPYENTTKTGEQSIQGDTPGDAGQLKSREKISSHNINKVTGNKVNDRSSKIVESVPATPRANDVPAQDEAAQNNNDKQVVQQPVQQAINNNVISDKILPRQNGPLPDVFKNDDSKKDTAISQRIASANSTKKKKTNAHYFYAGLMAGPDVTFVKFQKTNSVGYNAGLLMGYKFNKLSLETGFMYDKKNYYTKGEYFDKTKIPFFYNAELVSVDGYCHMYEIPLNIKYNFSEKKRHTWFATAGVSSYLMNKEYYNYDYILNDTMHRGGYPYYHASKNWFSVINLSAGYELRAGDKTTLRIEPYYKISATGVGTGNLSLSSTGINIGITRRVP